jgi:hypothetical protein
LKATLDVPTALSRAWVEIDRPLELPSWEGNRYFLPLLSRAHSGNFTA